MTKPGKISYENILSLLWYFYNNNNNRLVIIINDNNNENVSFCFLPGCLNLLPLNLNTRSSQIQLHFTDYKSSLVNLICICVNKGQTNGFKSFLSQHWYQPSLLEGDLPRRNGLYCVSIQSLSWVLHSVSNLGVEQVNLNQHIPRINVHFDRPISFSCLLPLLQCIQDIYWNMEEFLFNMIMPF